MDKKIFWMGLAALVLVLLMLACGGYCAYYIARAWRSHTHEVDEPQSSVERERGGATGPHSWPPAIANTATRKVPNARPRNVSHHRA